MPIHGCASIIKPKMTVSTSSTTHGGNGQENGWKVVSSSDTEWCIVGRKGLHVEDKQVSGYHRENGSLRLQMIQMMVLN